MIILVHLTKKFRACLYKSFGTKNSVCPDQAGWRIYMTKIVPLETGSRVLKARSCLSQGSNGISFLENVPAKCLQCLLTQRVLNYAGRTKCIATARKKSGLVAKYCKRRKT